MRVVRELRENGVAATVSGAGPTVLALPSGGTLPSGVDTAGFTVRALPVDRRGTVVEPAIAPNGPNGTNSR
jgi:homoserine kinase